MEPPGKSGRFILHKVVDLEPGSRLVEIGYAVAAKQSAGNDVPQLVHSSE